MESEKRMDRRTRHASILDAAIQEAELHGYNKVTRESIAQRAGVSPALVSVYLGTMINLRRQVMRAAVERGILPVIAQGIADRNSYAMAASEDLRKQALASLIQ